MWETFLANLGINLLTGNDLLDSTKNAGISAGTGGLFDKFSGFNLGSDITGNIGTVNNATNFNPALMGTPAESIYTDFGGNIANVGGNQITSAMQNPIIQNAQLGVPTSSMMENKLIRNPNLLQQPVDNFSTNLSPDIQNYQGQNQMINPYSDEYRNQMELGALTDATNVRQAPDFNVSDQMRGQSADYTGGGYAESTLPQKAYDKLENMVAGVTAGDVGTAGLLYFNKLDQDAKQKELLMAQRNNMIPQISRNPQGQLPAGQILKVKRT